MRIFLTGATGFIGSHIVPELVERGHQVLGLTRSESGEAQLRKAGAEPHRGDLEDPSTLRQGAEKADAVIHCAFDHDFTRFVANCEKDMRNIAAMGEALAGSKRPLLISSGVGMGSRKPGELATEDWFAADNPHPRKMSELAGNALLEKGINVSVVRLPQVHDTRKQGLVTPLIELARAKGRVGYLGEGQNRYAAAHVTDVAHLYALAIERAEEGARWNAVAEEGIPLKDIAVTIGKRLGLPVASVSGADAEAYFGGMMMFAGMDAIGSSAITRKKLGWEPKGRGLLADLAELEL